jgi:hypothetical protein
MRGTRSNPDLVHHLKHSNAFRAIGGSSRTRDVYPETP